MPTRPSHSAATPAVLAAHMKQEMDLDALRDREDFKKLLEHLEAKK